MPVTMSFSAYVWNAACGGDNGITHNMAVLARGALPSFCWLGGHNRWCSVLGLALLRVVMLTQGGCDVAEIPNEPPVWLG